MGHNFFSCLQKSLLGAKMAVKHIVVVMRPLRAAADGGCPHVLILPVGGE